MQDLFTSINVIDFIVIDFFFFLLYSNISTTQLIGINNLKKILQFICTYMYVCARVCAYVYAYM